MRFAETARFLLCFLVALGLTAASAAANGLPSPPPPEDASFEALRAYQQALLDHYGGDYRDVPLEAKAEFFEWQIWRYHLGPHLQVMPRAVLPDTADGALHYPYGADTSTWNGALLAALSRKYQVTRDPVTLERIAQLLEGMHLFFQATGQPGLVARVVLPSPQPLDRARMPYPTRDGDLFYYRAEPAKGTLNQVTLGYALSLMHVLPDLPAPVRERAHRDLVGLALHLIRHDYQMTEVDGEPSRYGSLRPLFWGHGVPFNAHVATMAIGTAATFPPRHPEQARVIREEYERLRGEQPYWEPWWRPPFIVRPQRIVKSRFIKTNDVNHLLNAVHTGLELELFAAERDGREPDMRFLARFGEPLFWGLGKLERQRNSLCNFMVADMFEDAAVFEGITRGDRDAARERAHVLLEAGVEQLRRFTLDRFRWEGHEVTRREPPHWVDEHRPDNYAWKVDASLGWQVTGPPTPLLTSAIDYLHAYWLLRAAGLDAHPVVVARHRDVLEPSRTADGEAGFDAAAAGAPPTRFH